MSIRVLVADDEVLVRTGLRLILDTEADIEVVCTTRSRPGPVASCSRTRPRTSWSRPCAPPRPVTTCWRPSVTRRMITEFARRGPRIAPPPAVRALTARELEVLRLLARRPVQRGDRRRALHRRRHGQDPRRPVADQARRSRSSTSGRPRLPIRTRQLTAVPEAGCQ